MRNHKGYECVNAEAGSQEEEPEVPARECMMYSVTRQ